MAGLHRQGSTGSSGTRGSATVHLTDKPEKVPRYLRASTGSCHDMCKHGGQEMRKPLRRIWPRSSTNVVNSVEMVVLDKPKLEKVVKHESCVEVPSKGSCIGDEISSTDKHETDLSLKLSSSLRSKGIKVKQSTASSSAMHGKGPRHSNTKTGGKSTASGVPAKNASVSLSAPSMKARENQRLKFWSPLMHWRQMHEFAIRPSDREDSKTTLHIIKTGAENNITADANAIPVLPSPPPSSARPSPHSLSTLTPDKDAEAIKHTSNNTSPTKIGKTRHKDTSNITTSKWPGIVSEAISVDKRLQRQKFLTARILEVENDREPDSKDDAADPGLRPCLKANLKHHQVQSKKDNQGLFNNVIQETANQLVLNRKGKVKALVGAFEAVISLQKDTTYLHSIS